MEKTADLLYEAFSQNDVRGTSRAGRLIMQRCVASDGNTFERVWRVNAILLSTCFEISLVI